MGFDQELKNIMKKKGKGGGFSRALVLSLQWVSVGYSSALYFAGKKFGKEIVAKELTSNDINAVLKDVITFFKDFGIGKLSIKETDQRTATLTLKDGATSAGMSSVGKPVCFFEAGLIAGIIEGRLNKNTTVTELKCGGMGDSEDQFLVKMS
ncbi:MAG: DUF2507 domain-containing protein [Nanoarchaeota archaeon]|nr:DUF2507 domain-containing protein [Nanoarchaeota archaeon]MBU4123919.1 DUF2507 domain-containing protein [Nanoarchaeota archaeon]